MRTNEREGALSQKEQFTHSNGNLNAVFEGVSVIDHIANTQNDAWWEGLGHIFCPFSSHNASMHPSPFLPCLIFEIGDMVYLHDTNHSMVGYVSIAMNFGVF